MPSCFFKRLMYDTLFFIACQEFFSLFLFTHFLSFSLHKKRAANCEHRGLPPFCCLLKILHKISETDDGKNGFDNTLEHWRNDSKNLLAPSSSAGAVVMISSFMKRPPSLINLFIILTYISLTVNEKEQYFPQFL